MWIPVQPEGVTLRRLPYVTFGVIAFILLVQLGIGFFPKTRLKHSLLTAVQFSANHYFLKRSDEMTALVRANRHNVNAMRQKKGNAEGLARAQREHDQLVKVLMEKWHSHPVYYLAFKPSFNFDLEWFTYVFAGSSVLLTLWHLAILYICAPGIEDRWGRIYFGIFLIVVTLMGASGHSMHHDTVSLPLGSTGPMVAGVLGAYAVLFDKHRIQIRPLISRLDIEYRIPAWGVFLVWLAGCGIIMFAIRGGMKLGGMSWASLSYPLAFGLATAGIIQFLKLEKALYKSPFDRLELDQQYLVRVDRELRVGSPEKALDLLKDASEKFPDRLDFLQPCWDQAVRVGKMTQMEPIAAKLLAHYFGCGDLNSATFILKEIHKHDMALTLPEERIFEWAQQLLMAERGTHGVTLMRQFMPKPPPSSSNRDLALQLAADGDPNQAVHLVEDWLTSSPLDRETQDHLKQWRDHLEQQCGELESTEVAPIEISADPIQIGQEEDPFASTDISALQVIAIQPVGLRANGIVVRMPDGQQKNLPFLRIRAIAAAALDAIGDDAAVVMDLHLNDPWEKADKHSCLRIHSQNVQENDPLGQRLQKGESVFIKLGNKMTQESTRVLPSFDLFQGPLPRFRSMAEFEEDTYGLTS